MIINKYQKQPIKETPHKIDVREMYNKESAQVMLMALKPGESLKPHKTPVDVFFLLLKELQQFTLALKVKFVKKIRILKVRQILCTLLATIQISWQELWL